MPNGISRETFDGMNQDSKLGVLFDYVAEVRELQKKRKIRDPVLTFGGGMVGGFAAIMAKWMFWR